MEVVVWDGDAVEEGVDMLESPLPGEVWEDEEAVDEVEGTTGGGEDTVTPVDV